MNIYPPQEPLDRLAFTTLAAIRALSPSDYDLVRLLVALGKTQSDDVPVTFEHILETHGLDDALRCLQAAPQYDKQLRLYAVYCAQQVLTGNSHPDLLAAVDVAYRHAHGQATDKELAVSEAIAWATTTEVANAAAQATNAALAKWVEAVSIRTTSTAVVAAAWGALQGAEANAAYVEWSARVARATAAADVSAVWVAGEARTAEAWAAAWTAARKTAEADQEAEFRRVFCNKGAI